MRQAVKFAQQEDAIRMGLYNYPMMLICRGCGNQYAGYSETVPTCNDCEAKQERRERRRMGSRRG